MGRLLRNRTNTPKQAGSTWKEDLSEQVELSEFRSINAQMIPLNAVKIDLNNPRIAWLTTDEIKTAPKPNKDSGPGDFEFDIKVDEFFSAQEHAAEKKEQYLSLCSLALSIGTANGLIQPIVVYMVDNAFQLVSGHRRTMAHHIIGEKYISAIILESKPEALEKAVLQWKENNDRQDLNIFERIQFVQQFSNAYTEILGRKITAKDLMIALSIQKTQAHAYSSILQVFEKDNAFREALRDGTISSLKSADKLAKLSPTARHGFIQNLSNAALTVEPDAQTFSFSKQDLPVNKQDLPNFGLVINKNTDQAVIRVIIKELINSERIRELLDPNELNLDTKTTLLKAWSQIFHAVKQNIKKG